MFMNIASKKCKDSKLMKESVQPMGEAGVL